MLDWCWEGMGRGEMTRNHEVRNSAESQLREVTQQITFRPYRRSHLSSLLFLYLLQVGGIKPGCFKIGNTGGMLDNILASKLYRPGR